MRRFGGIEIRNLTGRSYGFPVEAVVADLLADVPAEDLTGLYQVALLDARKGLPSERTRWMGIYSNRDGRHALIELYLEPILGVNGPSKLDQLTGFLLSRLRLGQALFHQVGVHRQRITGRAWFFGSDVYSKYLLFRVFNPAKLLLYFPERILRQWRSELRRSGQGGLPAAGAAGRRARTEGTR